MPVCDHNIGMCSAIPCNENYSHYNNATRGRGRSNGMTFGMRGPWPTLLNALQQSVSQDEAQCSSKAIHGWGLPQ